MEYIPDAYDRWKDHEAEKEARLDKLPKCCECGEPIQDEYAYYIYGEWVCEECMNENFRKSVQEL